MKEHLAVPNVYADSLTCHGAPNPFLCADRQEINPFWIGQNLPLGTEKGSGLKIYRKQGSSPLLPTSPPTQ